MTLALDGIEVPADWPLEETRLDVHLGGEGLLRIAYPDGTRRGLRARPQPRALPGEGPPLRRRGRVRRPPPLRRPEPRRQPRAGAADPARPRARRVRAPGDPGRRRRRTSSTATRSVSPMLDRGRGRARRARLAERHARLRRARRAQRRVAADLGAAEADSTPRPPASATATAPASRPRTPSSSTACAPCATRYPQNGALALTGHAHIDLAWLWPLAETRRKANRTFSTMISLMDRHPELHLQRLDRPALRVPRGGRPGAPRPRSRRRSPPASGSRPARCGSSPTPTCRPARASCASSSTASATSSRRSAPATPSAGCPTASASRRRCRSSCTLAGITSFFTIKVNWSETNAMPYDLFWWEGLDGSRVLAHTFDNPVGGYNAETGARADRSRPGRTTAASTPTPRACSPSATATAAAARPRRCSSASASSPTSPCVPSLAPGQGRRLVRRGRARRSQDDADAAGLGRRDVPRAPPRHADDAGPDQVPAPPGRARAHHRRDARPRMATLLGEPIAASLEPHWRVLLRNEFHDILPGSSIREVYEDAEERARRRRRRGRRGRAPAGSPRSPRRSSRPATGPAVLVGEPGPLAAPAAPLSPTRCPAARPSRAAASSPPATRSPGLTARVVVDPKPARRPVGGDRLPRERRSYRVEIARRRHARAASSTSAPAARRWPAAATRSGPTSTSRATGTPGTSRTTTPTRARRSPPRAIEVVERGPHRAAIRVTRKFRDSAIVQTYRLWANSARLDFATDIDWHERRFLLKARFPLAIRSDRATFECAHGVDPPRHPPQHLLGQSPASRSPAHRFADLSEQGYGVALLNDGKYGHHALGNELGLSLLRSPVYPDPLADEGRQSFTYALFPHAGDWLAGGVLAEAEDLNRPLLGAAGEGRRRRGLDRGEARRACRSGSQRLQAGRGRRQARSCAPTSRRARAAASR